MNGCDSRGSRVTANCLLGEQLVEERGWAEQVGQVEDLRTLFRNEK